MEKVIQKKVGRKYIEIEHLFDRNKLRQWICKRYKVKDKAAFGVRNMIASVEREIFRCSRSKCFLSM